MSDCTWQHQKLMQQRINQNLKFILFFFSFSIFHRTRFCAALFARSRVMPAFVSSCSNDLLQVCLGCPRSLLPCGFQSSATLDMLSFGFMRVWPIHHHFLRLICRSMGSSSVNFNSATLLMVFGQNILQMMRRHLSTKVCSQCVMELETSHVSLPWSNTDFEYSRFRPHCILPKAALALFSLHIFIRAAICCNRADEVAETLHRFDRTSKIWFALQWLTINLQETHNICLHVGEFMWEETNVVREIQFFEMSGVALYNASFLQG